MAKKKAAARKHPPQFGFRCADDDEAVALETVATSEGYKSVAAWLYELAKRRKAKIDHCKDQGTYVRIAGHIVPTDEVPGANAAACQIHNAQAILETVSREPGEMDQAAFWLALATVGGTDEQRETAKALSAHLDAYREDYETHVERMKVFGGT